MNKEIKSIKTERIFIMFFSLCFLMLNVLTLAYYSNIFTEIFKDEWAFSDFKILFLIFICFQLICNFFMFFSMSNQNLNILNLLKQNIEKNENK